MYVHPSSIKVTDKYKGINWDKQIENRKSSTRCKVEHPFLSVGYRVKSLRRTQYRIWAGNFKTVQNKMQWAVHGQTAAEKPYVGMYGFKGEQPTQADVLVAKNNE